MIITYFSIFGAVVALVICAVNLSALYETHKLTRLLEDLGETEAAKLMKEPGYNEEVIINICKDYIDPIDQVPAIGEPHDVAVHKIRICMEYMDSLVKSSRSIPHAKQIIKTDKPEVGI